MALHPRLTAEGTQARINLVTADGKLYGGAEAIARVITMNPVGHFGWLYYVPGLRQLADVIYQFIARNRYRWWGRAMAGATATGGCEGDVCRIHSVDDGKQAS
jgi:predicted DCC family thiol-disulfide oxidoreductase YuxK